MAKVRKINVSQIEGNSSNDSEITDIRPFGEIGVYVNDDGPTNKPELLMFDGTKTHLRSKVLGLGTLYGSGADSGDGAGSDTIKLIPDATLYRNNGGFGNDQYIIVDPTGGEPGHIHLRAGGTQDSSTADLYLGGEQNFLRISDTGKNVTIKTTSLSNNSSTWTFNPLLSGEGIIPANITFPDGTQQTTAWSGGRVVNVPNFSIGAEGDRAGDIAFSNGFIYYCTSDYVGTATVAWSNVFDVTDGEGHYIQATISDPSQLNGNLSITGIVVNGAPASTQNVTSIELTTGTTYRFFLANTSETWNPLQGSELQVVPNIWRRVAWSADTW